MFARLRSYARSWAAIREERIRRRLRGVTVNVGRRHAPTAPLALLDITADASGTFVLLHFNKAVTTGAEGWIIWGLTGFAASSNQRLVYGSGGGTDTLTFVPPNPILIADGSNGQAEYVTNGDGIQSTTDPLDLLGNVTGYTVTNNSTQ